MPSNIVHMDKKWQCEKYILNVYIATHVVKNVWVGLITAQNHQFEL